MIYKAYPAYKDSGIEWLGEVPEHWDVVKLKRATQFLYGESLSQENRVEGKVPVYGSNGITGFHNRAITKSPCIIIGRKGSYGKVNYSEEECFPIDTTFYIDQTATPNNIRWLYFILINSELDSFSKDSAVPGLNREEAYDRIIVLPPLSEQQSIANYLDRRTHQIDTLIEKKQKQIDHLKEQRTATINQAVTKGLNPNVKMKDSGSDWLREIPVHWDKTYIKHICAKTKDAIVDGPFGSSVNVQTDYVDEGIPVVRTINISNNGFLEDDLRFISREKFEQLRRHAIYPNDVLLSKVGTIGNSCLFPQHIPRGMLSTTGSCKITTDKNLMIPNYLIYLFQSMKNQFMLLASSNVQPFLNMTTIKNIRIPLPPIEEQKDIVKYIEIETGRIDDITGKIEKQIELLKEYRTSLISEVVTGKIDVRDEI